MRSSRAPAHVNRATHRLQQRTHARLEKHLVHAGKHLGWQGYVAKYDVPYLHVGTRKARHSREGQGSHLGVNVER